MTARAALVCYRSTQTGPVGAEWTYWDGIGQAQQALAELASCGCGPLCIGVHSIARLDREPHGRRRPSLRTRTTSTTGADGAGT